MDGYAGCAPSPSDPSKEPVEPRPLQAPLQADVDMSGGSSGNETNENCSTGRDSQGSDCDYSGKELRTLVGPPGAHQGPDAFSLMMVKSEHNPSTSGCSSEQSTKTDAHKELIKTLRELKAHLPAEKKAKGKASTLATLKHALRSVKQVKASEEYYQLLMASEKQPCSAHVPAYTLREIESVTSEFVAKSTDMFAAAVSLVTGKTLYISDQAASIFHCKRDTFYDAKFVEFLAPRDVSVFRGSTSPYKLPPWGLCRGADSFTQECMEEKSFFCRVSVGRNHESELRYQPFRMTPHLVRVCDPRGTESQLCCVLLAERVHSGYEAPRIPPEKRIFTTTHSPNCLFQDVDESGGFEELLQWFQNAKCLWRLVPTPRSACSSSALKPVFCLPVVQSGGQPFDYSPIRFRAHNGEYVTLDTSWSSFVNPWSRKVSFVIGRHRVRAGPLNEDVFSAQPCVEEKAPQPGVQELTEQIRRLLLQPVPHSCSSGYGSLGSNGYSGAASISQNSSAVVPPGAHSSSPTHVGAVPAAEKDSSGASLPEELACRNQPTGSYQQISCLDGVIRYLESCSEAATLKRKCEFPTNLPTPKASDRRKTAASPGPHSAETASPSKVNGRADVSTHLTSLTLPGKAESAVSLSSQCSFSSTIVHVGDRKPQPELETVEDATSGPESLDCLAGPALPCSLDQDPEPFRKLGLTKEVLAAHTQKEEQSFLLKFKEIRKLNIFQSPCQRYLQERAKGQLSDRTAAGLRNTSGIDSTWKKTGKNRKLKSKRVKPRDSSGSTGSGGPAPQRPPLLGLNAAAWSPSDTSPSSCPLTPFPAPGPACSLPVFPAPGAVAAVPHASFAVPMDTQHEFAAQPPAFAGPLAPVLALVVPSYPFSPVASNLPQAVFPGQPSFPSQVTPASQPEFPGQTSPPKQPHTCLWAEPAGPVGRTSPPLFQSRGSSPLQLSLLQLDEAPEGSASATGTVGAGPDCKPGSAWDRQPKAPPTCEEPADARSSDVSASSDLLRLLLREDLCSATGSALSGSGASAASCSLGSGSQGCSTSPSGTGSSDTGHSSRYFGSIDSSEKNHTAKVKADGAGDERFIKCVLQGPFWLLAADTDDRVMMAYQMPSRNVEAVLQEDREKLKALQGLQPRFTAGQRQELQDVHPWMRSGGLPAAIDVTVSDRGKRHCDENTLYQLSPCPGSCSCQGLLRVQQLNPLPLPP
uniref:Period circadian regulator 2 n=1 Tax=Catagonus wagneri TaxID=51154 RepID=A0A8C3YNR6_9CETA